jgi:hypothetical protein
MMWHIRPIALNHGKPVVVSEFEFATRIGDILIWIIGETELATIRMSDDWMVNKHYHLTGLDDLGVIDELVALLVDDCAPAAAVVAQSPGNPS